jgi:hypothetical protein
MGQEPQPPQAQRTADAVRAFDLWLQRSLHRLYDQVAEEPVPPELRRLVEQERGG